MTATGVPSVPPSAPRILGVLALLLVLLPATGQAVSVGEVDVRRVDTFGPGSMQGGLAVLVQERTQPHHASGDPGFQLDAQHLRVETDHSDAALGTGTRTNPTTTPSAHDGANVQGLGHRDNYQFSIWPLSGSTARVQVAESNCATLLPSDEARLDRAALVQDASARPGNVAAIDGAARWQGCNQHSVTVTGDFLLRLWEWDAELTADGESMMLYSGKRNLDGSPQTGDPTDLSTVVGQATEQYLYVTNGTLTVPRLSGNYELYVEDLDVEAEALRLHQARGSVLGRAVTGQDVTVRGDLHLALHGTGPGDPLSGLLGGDVAGLELDGVQHVVLSDGGLAWQVWAVGLVLVAGLLVVFAFPLLYHRRLSHRDPERLQGLQTRTLRQRYAAGLAALARAGLDRGRARTAARLASWSLRFHVHPQALVTRAKAFYESGRVLPLHQTHRFLHGVLQGDRREQCRNAWHAHQHLRSMHPELAQAWMVQAQKAHPLEWLRLERRSPQAPEGKADPSIT